MKTHKLFELPFATTALVRDPSLSTDGGDLLLAMDFDDNGQHRPLKLWFVKPRAFRKRAEIYCTSWHVRDAYDTVCEVEESDWVEELRAACVPDWRDRWEMRHFMIYVDSFGCLEVVAESVLLNGGSEMNSGGT